MTNYREQARVIVDQYAEDQADTGACQHCGEVWTNEMLRDDKRVPTHDYPKPCRQVCPGSGQFPVPNVTPLVNSIATALVAAHAAGMEEAAKIADVCSCGSGPEFRAMNMRHHAIGCSIHTATMIRTAAAKGTASPADRCEHGILWSMECLSCGHSDYVAAAPEVPPIVTVSEMLRPAPEAGVEEADKQVAIALLREHNDFDGFDEIFTDDEDADLTLRGDRLVQRIATALAAARLRGEGEVPVSSDKQDLADRWG